MKEVTINKIMSLIEDSEPMECVKRELAIANSLHDLAHKITDKELLNHIQEIRINLLEYKKLLKKTYFNYGTWGEDLVLCLEKIENKAGEF